MTSFDSRSNRFYQRGQGKAGEKHVKAKPRQRPDKIEANQASGSGQNTDPKVVVSMRFPP